MSDDLRDRLESVVLEHWREICKPRPDARRVKELAATAKELRAALRKGKAA